ncbi:hypothetical protein PsorP6_012047 [Peronosclerospora sorghi]|uniref:Uncharacterized protein n=1 Tax=Peronosclerospora sorghi TaxID=230839 RepID=A0ACC0WJ30_9STRA|nr:hypothetical protein PsorP6_012047 [Peronosclerospora sorghi]
MRLYYLKTHVVFIIEISKHGVNASVSSPKALVHDATDLESSRKTQASTSIQRLLRGNVTVSSEREERIKPPIFEKVERIAPTPFMPSEKEFQEMLDAKEAESDVFRHMGLINLTGSELFNHPFFKRWLDFVKALNERYPEEGAHVLPTLLDHLNDVGLYKMLDTATTHSNPELSKSRTILKLS